ncbi:hypothetical protein E2C01_018029 [Portunus trituberculatus]|uniref:Uncharacterized protein n=1 Tax=Portunus trituberculatus TaxID=210409 RepID=A0A5B7DUF1_PORTR|nr:hypothetical protein [Portunus trituberculatus]
MCRPCGSLQINYDLTNYDLTKTPMPSLPHSTTPPPPPPPTQRFRFVRQLESYFFVILSSAIPSDSRPAHMKEESSWTSNFSRSSNPAPLSARLF